MISKAKDVLNQVGMNPFPTKMIGLLLQLRNGFKNLENNRLRD